VALLILLVLCVWYSRVKEDRRRILKEISDKENGVTRKSFDLETKSWALMTNSGLKEKTSSVTKEKKNNNFKEVKEVNKVSQFSQLQVPRKTQFNPFNCSVSKTEWEGLKTTETRSKKRQFKILSTFQSKHQIGLPPKAFQNGVEVRQARFKGYAEI